MANYNYDEAGNMAAYFLLSFLSLILIPLSISSSRSSTKQVKSGCQCRLCVQQRENIRKREGGSLLRPKLRRKTIIVLVGWSLVAFLIYKIATTEVENKIYDPFEILGIRTGTTLKEIKSHYKKLSRKYHPDKVKLAVNETIEAVEAKFVELTKAYKSLTDETIRKNWELYGHPDGRQEVSMGIALPKWIVESSNNVWVLGVYGLIFGGALPALVGRWWFGNRQKTKDGVNARSAAIFFKNLTEESGIDEVVGSLAKTFEWECPQLQKAKQDAELSQLQESIQQKLGGGKWRELIKIAELEVEKKHPGRRRAFVLLFAHLLRLQIHSSALQTEQVQVLLQTPVLLNSFVSISQSKNWLLPTLAGMRLHAYLAQALPPGEAQLRLAQLPGFDPEEAAKHSAESKSLDEFVDALEEKHDERVTDVRKAFEQWGKVQIVDAAFKVIGERFVTPSSIVYLLVKLRLASPAGPTSDEKTANVDARAQEEKETEFLMSRKDAEDLPEGATSGWAHAPYWPANRKPGWWIVLADIKTNKVVVPPLRITDVPSRSVAEHRSYKVQFQAPPSPGYFTWKLFLISDTFVGEEVAQDIALKVDDASVLNADENAAEDDISDPEEDSLAGQMAMMRGGSVKKARPAGESDDESSTDDDRDSDSDSSSDSD